VVVLAGAPALGGVATVLEQQTEVVHPVNAQHLPQALVCERVLAPLAAAVAMLAEVLEAPGHSLAEQDNGFPGERLKSPMHAGLAVVQVHALRLLCVALQGSSQPRRKEDTSRVHLHCPVVLPEAPLAHNLLPDLDEDVRVLSHGELVAESACQVAVDHGREQPRRHEQGPLAVDRVLVAGEDAGALLDLHLQQLLLIAVRHQVDKAEE